MLVTDQGSPVCHGDRRTSLVPADYRRRNTGWWGAGEDDVVTNIGQDVGSGRGGREVVNVSNVELGWPGPHKHRLHPGNTLITTSLSLPVSPALLDLDSQLQLTFVDLNVISLIRIKRDSIVNPSYFLV